MINPLFDEDRQLARRLAAGDEAAFDKFFEEYFPRLYRFVLSRAGSDCTIADDVVQEALMIAVSQIDRYRGEAQLFSWLCTITRRILSRREQIERRHRDRVMLADDNSDVQAALESLTSDEPIPEQQLEARELKQLVHLALDALPERYASALTMKYLEDRKVDDISQQLELSPKAAESLLTRARNAFRDALTSLVEGMPDAPGISR